MPNFEDEIILLEENSFDVELITIGVPVQNNLFKISWIRSAKLIDFHMDRNKSFWKDGEKYPYHPVDTSKYSNDPVGYHSCLGCGSHEHEFLCCLTRFSQNSRGNFHFELHCHYSHVSFRNYDEQDNFNRRLSPHLYFSNNISKVLFEVETVTLQHGWIRKIMNPIIIILQTTKDIILSSFVHTILISVQWNFA